MIKKTIAIIFSIIFFISCSNSKPPEKLTDQIAKDLVDKGNYLYAVEGLQRVNGWSPEEGKNIYIVKYKYEKILKQNYSSTLLNETKIIYQNIDPENKIIRMESFLQLLTLENWKIFDEASSRSAEYINTNKEKLSDTIKSCDVCLKYLNEFPKESLVTFIRMASMAQAIVSLNEKHGIPPIKPLSNVVQREIEFSLRKTDSGWDLVK